MEFDKIRNIIAEHLQKPAESITAEMRFKEDLKADSLELFEIISHLDEEYGIELSNEDAEEIKTVGDAVEMFKKYVNA